MERVFEVYWLGVRQIIPFLHICSALTALVKSYQCRTRCPAYKLGVQGNGLNWSFYDSKIGKLYTHYYSSKMALERVDIYVRCI